METELAVPKTEEDEGRTRVEAVERSLSLLQCFRQPGEALSLAVLAQRSSLYKSTILRLTASLVYMKFCERDADLAAIAVGLTNENHELLGALTVSGLLTRFTPDQIKSFRKLLIDTANELRPRLPPLSIINQDHGA